jgi:hypothetical protein
MFQYEDFIPFVVRNEEDAVYIAKNISEPIMPIFFCILRKWIKYEFI